ncbi:MAG: hypothetical protein WCD36_10605 [Rhodanobacteraceae bacterium]
MKTVVLDLDGSATGIDDALVLPLRESEQALRFACSMRRLDQFSTRLQALLPDVHGTVLTGSGDFHHLSLPLIQRAAARHGSLMVVVLDNHPDNMRFPFAVHCGSWVRRVSALPGVEHVHVVGITSPDIGAGHAWQNYWRPLRQGRLTYWSTGVDTDWSARFGMGSAFRSFADTDALLQSLVQHLQDSQTPLYLSIDKDVLSAQDARTNWDQGVMRVHQMVSLIRCWHGRIVASDITGEISQIRYCHLWKRALAALDGQPAVAAAKLEQWQRQQSALNLTLLQALDQANVARAG